MTTATPSEEIHSLNLNLSSNFAAKQQQKFSSSSSASPTSSIPVSIGYDHEIYLQLIGGAERGERSPNQIYIEERQKRLQLRANDPAISDPQGDPSPIDFECAENQQRRMKIANDGR